MKLKDSISKVAEAVSGNKSTILAIVSMIGLVVTTGTTAYCSIKAKEIIDENDGVITKDVVKDVAIAVAPAAIAFTATMAADIMLQKSYQADIAKYAAAAALYAGDSKKLEELKNKIIHDKSDDKETSHDEKKSISKPNEDKVTSDTIHIWDSFRGDWIDTTYMDLFRARDVVNASLTSGDEVWLQDFYDILKVDDIGEALRGYHWIPFNKDETPWAVKHTPSEFLTIEFDAGIDDNLNVYPTFSFGIDPTPVEY